MQFFTKIMTNTTSIYRICNLNIHRSKSFHSFLTKRLKSNRVQLVLSFKNKDISKIRVKNRTQRVISRKLATGKIIYVLFGI